MHIPSVSSVPTGLIVANLFVRASVPSTEFCYRTVLQNEGQK